MNFPFTSFFAGRPNVAAGPEDFSTDFERMRQRNDWVKSAFDFDSLDAS